MYKVLTAEVPLTNIEPVQVVCSELLQHNLSDKLKLIIDKIDSKISEIGHKIAELKTTPGQTKEVAEDTEVIKLITERMIAHSKKFTNEIQTIRVQMVEFLRATADLDQHLKEQMSPVKRDYKKHKQSKECIETARMYKEQKYFSSDTTLTPEMMKNLMDLKEKAANDVNRRVYSVVCKFLSNLERSKENKPVQPNI